MYYLRFLSLIKAVGTPKQKQRLRWRTLLLPENNEKKTPSNWNCKR